MSRDKAVGRTGPEAAASASASPVGFFCFEEQAALKAMMQERARTDQEEVRFFMLYP
jgi:hypothetical protein